MHEGICTQVLLFRIIKPFQINLNSGGKKNIILNLFRIAILCSLICSKLILYITFAKSAWIHSSCLHCKLLHGFRNKLFTLFHLKFGCEITACMYAFVLVHTCSNGILSWDETKYSMLIRLEHLYKSLLLLYCCARYFVCLTLWREVHYLSLSLDILIIGHFILFLRYCFTFLYLWVIQCW